MTLERNALIDNWLILAEGYSLTIVVCALALVLALLGGTLLALGRLSRLKVLNYVSISYIELFRNIPFLIQIFLWYYVLPFVGFRFPAAVVGAIGLSAYGSAYYAEIIRGAIQSVPKGQLESARVTGMSYTQAMRHIIFPQMLGYLIPPATNQSTSLIKESSLLSTITVMELTMSAQTVQAATYDYVEVLVAIALLYWMTNETLSRTARKLEHILQPYKQRQGKANGQGPRPISPQSTTR
jgi:His/Glu/Gln/Arg/opine family amino acid ABC transporter permease subunit